MTRPGARSAALRAALLVPASHALVLDEACRCADRLDVLDAALVAEPLHLARLREARAQAALLARLVAVLVAAGDLDDDVVAPVVRAPVPGSPLQELRARRAERLAQVAAGT